MPQQTTTNCRGCGALIRFVKTEASGGQKSIPLDYDYNDEGNVRISAAGLAEILGPLEREIARNDGDQLLMPHHATCPNAEAFTGSKR